jgi:ferric-dicitrate binding protein FerR (iron transport regulator)
MNETIRHTLDLGEGNLLRIDDGAGVLVSVLRGAIWITQEGDRRDVLLAAGQSVRIENDGLTLIQGLAPSALTLSAPRQRERVEPAGRFSLVLAAPRG